MKASSKREITSLLRNGNGCYLRPRIMGSTNLDSARRIYGIRSNRAGDQVAVRTIDGWMDCTDGDVIYSDRDSWEVR